MYIGQTIRNPKKRRYEHAYKARRGVGFAFHKAIKKYGIENFLYKELAIVHSDNKSNLCDVLNQLEKDYIKKYKASGIQLYNRTEGGDFYYDLTGTHISEEHKQSISKWSREWHSKLTSEERRILSESISKGRKKTYSSIF